MIDISTPLLQQTVTPDPKRWRMVAIFSAGNACNAVLWITFAPIQDFVESFYNVDAMHVSLLSIAFMVLYIPAAIIVAIIFERWGFRIGIIFGAVLNAVCSWIRYFGAIGTISYNLILIGTIFGAVAQPIFTSSPAKLTSIWFTSKDRDIATAVAAMFVSFIIVRMTISSC